jgi:glycosyltransferase involved in cell wall biosynthesis
METVSIMVPVYNAKTFLVQCFESLIQQTYPALEIILVDDGSTDDSGRMCDEFSRRDSRIRVIHQKNSGVSVARNMGIEAATGEYIQFVDADDFLDLRATECLVSSMRSQEVQMVIGKPKRIIGLKIMNSKLPAKEYLNTDFAAFGFFNDTRSFMTSAIWGRLYVRDLILEHKLVFSTPVHVFEDILFNMAYLSKARRVISISDTVYFHRYSNNNAVKYYNRHGFLEMLNVVYDQLIEIFAKWPEVDQVRIRCHCNNFYANKFVGFVLCSFKKESGIRFSEGLKRTREGMSSFPRIFMALQDYSPPPGYSKMIPFLIRMKSPVLVACAAKIMLTWQRIRKSWSRT